MSVLREGLGIDSDSVIRRLEREYLNPGKEHEMPGAECRTEEQPGTERETETCTERPETGRIPGVQMQETTSEEKERQDS